MSYGKVLMLAGLVSVSVMGTSIGWADETTTTTTTKTQTPGEPGVVVGVPGVVGVEVGKRPAEPCAQHKTTTTNEDTGTSVTTKETNC